MCINTNLSVDSSWENYKLECDTIVINKTNKFSLRMYWCKKH